MLGNRLCFLLVGFCMMLCFTATAELTAEQAVEQMHAQAQALFLMPLKATYQEDTYTYYTPSDIVSYPEDGKVIATDPNTRATVINPETGETEETFFSNVAYYDSTIDMAVREYASSTTLYLCDERYRLEQHDAQGIVAATIWDGGSGSQLGKITRPVIRVGYSRFLAGSTGVINPLIIAYHRRRAQQVESYALEQEGDLYKLTSLAKHAVTDYWFDPERNYIISRFRVRHGDWLFVESKVTGIVRLADLYLPGEVQYTEYFEDGKVRFHYQASNITWELVSDIENKFTGH